MSVLEWREDLNLTNSVGSKLFLLDACSDSSVYKEGYVILSLARYGKTKGAVPEEIRVPLKK